MNCSLKNVSCCSATVHNIWQVNSLVCKKLQIVETDTLNFRKSSNFLCILCGYFPGLCTTRFTMNNSWPDVTVLFLPSPWDVSSRISLTDQPQVTFNILICNCIQDTLSAIQSFSEGPCYGHLSPWAHTISCNARQTVTDSYFVPVSVCSYMQVHFALCTNSCKNIVFIENCGITCSL